MYVLKLSREIVASAKVDSAICDWEPSNENENPMAFFIKKGAKRLSPIFDFTLFNHFTKPILLTNIYLKVNFFELGITGLPEPVKKVKPFDKFSFPIEYDKNDYSFTLDNPVEIDIQRAFRFQVELLLPNNEPLTRRYGVYFSFRFNNNQLVKAPVILLNSDNEEGTFKIVTLS